MQACTTDILCICWGWCDHASPSGDDAMYLGSLKDTRTMITYHSSFQCVHKRFLFLIAIDVKSRTDQKASLSGEKNYLLSEY